MDSGKLRQRVLFEALVAQTDTADDVIQDEATGVVDRVWTPIAEVWAAIEPLSAREFLAAQAVQSKVTTRITIRNPRTWAVSPAMRLVQIRRGGVRGATYNIEGVLPDRESGLEYLTLPCSAGVSVDGQ
jgi:SPP1 family predicted phage head-tail adaptor